MLSGRSQRLKHSRVSYHCHKRTGTDSLRRLLYKSNRGKKYTSVIKHGLVPILAAVSAKHLANIFVNIFTAYLEEAKALVAERRRQAEEDAKRATKQDLQKLKLTWKPKKKVCA